MRLNWSENARRDLRLIHKFITRENPPAAAQTLLKILRQTLRLADHPQLGRPGRVIGTRELVVSGVPYVIAYAIGNEAVTILRVLHAARKWPSGF